MQVNSLLGKKTRQSQGFLQNGIRVPLSAVLVAGNFITQIKTKDKEGYNSLQLGIESNKKAKRSIAEHAKKAGLKNTPRFFREIRMDDVEGANLGSEINIVDVFAPGDMVDVTGVSKGKGFAGGVKRHGFHGGPRTHGQSDRERSPGSIGQTTTPGRVYRGKRMAGRMGQDTVTVKNLEIIEITNDGVLLIKGLVPGSLNSLVVVKKIGVNKKFVPLYKEVVDEPAVEEVVAETEVKVESGESLPASDEAQVVETSKEAAVEEVQAPVAEDKKEEVKEVASVENSSEPKEDKK